MYSRRYDEHLLTRLFKMQIYEFIDGMLSLHANGCKLLKCLNKTNNKSKELVYVNFAPEI